MYSTVLKGCTAATLCASIIDEGCGEMEYQIDNLKVTLVKEGVVKVNCKPVSNPQAVYDVVNTYLKGVDREHFVVLMVNVKNMVIGINTVSIGTLDSAMAHPREVFKPAILAGARAVIVAHNHLSGDATPSKSDVVVTQKLVDAGELLSIPVIDHVIIGDLGGVCKRGFVSMKELGVM